MSTHFFALEVLIVLHIRKTTGRSNNALLETATTIDDHVYECLNYTTTFLSLITSGEKDPRHLTKTLNATLLNGAYLKGYAYTVCKLSVDVNTEIYSGLLFSC